MSFGENLQFLRKRNNITQEQLAEKLNVSRQSVSKWESDGSFPEMEKILIICEMFSCDMDTLMRGNAEDKVADNKEEYEEHMNSRSKWTAGAVSLILLSLGLESIISDISNFKRLEGVIFVLCAAMVVVIFIVKGLQHDSFKRRFPYFSPFYSEGELYQFEKKYPVFVAIPVAAIILGLALCAFLNNMNIGSNVYGGLFFFILALAVGTLIYGGTQKEKYDINAYNKECAKEKSETGEKIGKWCGIIMLIATALFIVSIGLSGMDYMKAEALGVDYSYRSSILAFSWVVFPVGAILCGIASIALSKTKEKEIEK